MILACGEALIDMLPRTTTEGGDAFAPHAGGAVFNTAIALGRLGVPAGFLCGLSDDLFGDILRDTLRASQVDAALSPTYDRPTTLAFVKLVEGQATYAFYDENTAMRALTEADLPDVGDAEALFFGGISLVGGACGDAYEALMLREAGRRVTMIDPNIRPSFIRDEAAYRARVTRMMAVADIVKLSDEDLHWLMGDGDLATLAERVRETGPSLVCITEGSKGVTAYSARGATFVPAEKAEVVDTVGAGDTFNAGLLAHLHKEGHLTKAALADLSEAHLAEALAFGAKVAGIVVARAGANPPWAQDL